MTAVGYRLPYKCLKPFWSDEIDSLKEISIAMHKLLIQCGRPMAGVINTTRLKAKNDYKLAYKCTTAHFEKMNADVISDHLLEKDTNSF